MTSLVPLLLKDIERITTELISHGLSVDQRFPSNRELNSNTLIDWGKHVELSIVFKDIDYRILYDELERERNYNIKLVDGALLQMMYTVSNNRIVKHRLAFFPCPYLEKFQNDPDIYSRYDLYADCLAKNIVPIPIRFDFDEEVHDEIHAKSHASFGQYKNCRIPVWGPLSPTDFVEFILKNFYATAYHNYSLNFKSDIVLNRTIVALEESGIHFNAQR
ncbi:DUF2290 domain-containing protein [Paenibacillus sp. P13VS]|uniref:DUF2290 domain-containing protein n=1 Tax=Paenibacillus sp. P13VS TaxID=2697367 RepID=UPI00187BB196|nr:DUF2290 domain-containing protein [Paenibacillus sp. P13VS]MBE7682209.1 DUF2290 domain-containing protein [Paenibacillus sp. P13VS]